MVKDIEVIVAPSNSKKACQTQMDWSTMASIIMLQVHLCSRTILAKLPNSHLNPMHAIQTTKQSPEGCLCNSCTIGTQEAIANGNHEMFHSLMALSSMQQILIRGIW